MADDLVLSMFIVGKILKGLFKAVAAVFRLLVKVVKSAQNTAREESMG